MRHATLTQVKSCAKDLQAVRAQLLNNLEPSVIELLDSVIGRLEQCETVANDRAALATLIDDGLQLAARLVEIGLVIAEVVNHCG